MKILALETSGMSGSVATLDTATGEGPRGLKLPDDQRSARALAPTIRQAFTEAGWKPSDVNVVAVTVGPGSFTGLRIGITTAKLLAYAWKADLVAVDTLDVLARQADADPAIANATTLHAILDAHRQELFHARYLRFGSASGWQRVTDSHLMATDAWLASLQSGNAAVGPMIPRLAARLPADAVLASPERHEPQAATVAQLAAELHQQGRRDDPYQLRPRYLRLAAAEEKRALAQALNRSHPDRT